ncbi:zonular occludens toxin domain-containing protein [Paenibacillus sp. 1781tsa1]|uniref:zonular occludens toxin domain-containing protein n=1 Tax=Paenibacillus sp. 1781tsa1 TaxID=2953810 RepID=UPI0020A2130C|nr:zonular occludens toxin domain-containing protein [Paenibacillus sp. 1781tsa1]MCP1187565.1 zonular occludens toxin domain-containing protein [Paenibacillus sp. 1781tsa1]
MISLYTGSVGSGKSYHGTQLGLEWIKRKYVIANYPIKPPKRIFPWQRARVEREMERWIFEEEITPEYLIAKSIEMGFMGKESSCLVQIDEAGIIFNARDWQSAAAVRTKWIKFLSQSRKFGYDFVFIAQSDRMIDKQIRGLVEYDVKHLKANNSIMFSFLSLFRITMFMYIYKWYHTKVKANLRFGRYRKSIADRYDTMRTFNLEELTLEIEKMYDGAVVPAPVAVQIAIWKDEIEKKRQEKLAAQEQEEESIGADGGGQGVPTGGTDAPEHLEVDAS